MPQFEIWNHVSYQATINFAFNVPNNMISKSASAAARSRKAFAKSIQRPDLDLIENETPDIL